MRQVRYGLRSVGLSTFALSLGCSIAWAQPRERPIDKVKLGEAPAADTTDKIVGGTLVEPGRYPFQVALIRAEAPVDKEHFGQFCGGALVSSKWVLTAAHCVPDTRPEEIDAYIGSTVLPAGAVVGGARGVRRHVSQVISHPAYEDATHDNDIALLKLTEPAPDQLAPAVIATSEVERERAAAGKRVTVIGWGALNEGGATTPRLMEVAIIVQDRALCQSNYQAVVPSSRITENMFCAGEPAGGRDSCQGDSGGFIGAPLSDGRFAQLGIVSWGMGCARPQLFGVYTRAAKYGAWIKQMMVNFN